MTPCPQQDALVEVLRYLGLFEGPNRETINQAADRIESLTAELARCKQALVAADAMSQDLRINADCYNQVAEVLVAEYDRLREATRP
jgi:hypothetical protein